MKKNKRLIFLFNLVIIGTSLFGQYDHQHIYSDLTGDDLYEALVEDYKPDVVLTYGMARDTLFKNIDAVNDSLECAYTGMKRYLAPDEDPTQTVFLNGANNGINTEHSYPQSKGAEEGNARSDMHHLYPTRVKTNSDRGSLIFADVNDSQTITWYKNTTELSSIPNQNIDDYSELGVSTFEPRESYKGNIARSIMYFYTMYRSEAIDADPSFFDQQIETLCDWHYEDPVDQIEWERTMKIAPYQDGKANPFVLDCSLASRLYCSEISAECIAVDVDDIVPIREIDVYPNPVNNILYIGTDDIGHTANIIDLTGKVKVVNIINNSIDVSTLASGIYLLTMRLESQFHSQVFIKI